jgi:hypothetical protein
MGGTLIPEMKDLIISIGIPNKIAKHSIDTRSSYYPKSTVNKIFSFETTREMVLDKAHILRIRFSEVSRIPNEIFL